MAGARRWECKNCKVVIESQLHPNKKAAGACEKDPKGEHDWIEKRR